MQEAMLEALRFLYGQGDPPKKTENIPASQTLVVDPYPANPKAKKKTFKAFTPNIGNPPRTQGYQPYYGNDYLYQFYVPYDGAKPILFGVKDHETNEQVYLPKQEVVKRWKDWKANQFTVDYNYQVG